MKTKFPYLESIKYRIIPCLINPHYKSNSSPKQSTPSKNLNIPFLTQCLKQQYRNPGNSLCNSKFQQLHSKLLQNISSLYSKQQKSTTTSQTISKLTNLSAESKRTILCTKPHISTFKTSFKLSTAIVTTAYSTTTTLTTAKSSTSTSSITISTHHLVSTESSPAPTSKKTKIIILSSTFQI